MVNVTGFLAVQRLTTNVTGHFTYFVHSFLQADYFYAFIYLTYLFFFLFGSFTSNFLIEIVSRINERYIYVVPVTVEIFILTAIGLAGHKFIDDDPNVIACALLFAMGLQNSLVTQISNAVVRTTHMTGLFTDLGIELSQLFFYKTEVQKKKLTSSIKLRLTIISFFFIGGITGGELFEKIGTKTLVTGAFALTTGLVYDTIKFRIILLKRKFTR